MVVMVAPSAWTASTVQDLTASPSMWIVQAPHDDVSQPMFVPVSAQLDSPFSKGPLRFVDPAKMLDDNDKWNKLYAEIFTGKIR